jgi:hypothetical protein
MQEQQKSGSGGRRNQHKAVMARIQRAASDSLTRDQFVRDPHTVKGFDTLPQQVQDTLHELGSDELAALSKVHDSFAEAGLYDDAEDEHGGGRVSFF